VARQIERLCHFAIARVGERDFAAARQVLLTLKESFEGIMEQANELERSGVIPRLEEDRTLSVTA